MRGIPSKSEEEGRHQALEDHRELLLFFLQVLLSALVTTYKPAVIPLLSDILAQMLSYKLE